MKLFSKQTFAVAAVSATIGFSSVGHAALTNADFEAGLAGWTTFENVFAQNTMCGPDFCGPESHDQMGAGGTMKMFGPFVVNGASGAYQADDSVGAGDTVDLSVWLTNWNGDPFTNTAIVQLNFWDADGGQLGTGTNIGGSQQVLNAVDLPGNNGEWNLFTELTINAIAPAGTESAEVFLLHIQEDPVSGGSIFFDDVTLDVTPVPVPAAAWLFGSALLGLAGIGRKRRA